MDRREIYDYVLILILVLLFPLLWLFNQRINYRKFLTFDTKFSLSSGIHDKSKLSSTTFLLDFLNNNGKNMNLSYQVIATSPFVVLGRVFTSPEGVLEVYEYGSSEDAAKQIKRIEKDPSLLLQLKDKTVTYKNLIIYNKNQIQGVNELIKGLSE